MRNKANLLVAVAGAMATAIAVGAADIGIEQNEPPDISHFPTIQGYRGQPIPVYAKVTDKTGKLKKVSLYYALSQQQVPLEVPMKKTSENTYSGLIPANFFHQSHKIWYFVSAEDSFEDKADTTWFPVIIKDPKKEKAEEQAVETPVTAGSTASPKPAKAVGTASGNAGPSASPIPEGATLTSGGGGGGIGGGTWLVGGLVVAGGVGAAVALSGGGGGGGGGDDGGGGGGGSGAAPTGPIEGTGSVSSRDVEICVIDFNSVQDDFYDLYVNGDFVGSMNNSPGGTTCRGATLVSGANIITLKLTETKGSSTLLRLQVNGGEFSRDFNGSSDHNFAITAP